jgi:hypothetical protein
MLANNPPRVAEQLRRRRNASYRLPPLRNGARDPLDRLASPSGPSDYGLDPFELAAEIDRRRMGGLAGWELELRFADPQWVAA